MSYAEDFNIDICNRYDCSINYNTKTWTTKDGKTLPIYAMDDRHLLNTIRYIKRKGFAVPYEMEREVHVRQLKENN